MSRIPGIPAKHAIISDDCRRGRGDDGAIDEAIRRMREAYDQLMKCWPVGRGTKFHVVLTVECDRNKAPTDGAR